MINWLQALADAKVLAKEIEEKQLVLKMKVGEGGRTFGSISTKEIAAEAKKQLGYDLDKKKCIVNQSRILDSMMLRSKFIHR